MKFYDPESKYNQINLPKEYELMDENEILKWRAIIEYIENKNDKNRAKRESRKFRNQLKLEIKE